MHRRDISLPFCKGLKLFCLGSLIWALVTPAYAAITLTNRIIGIKGIPLQNAQTILALKKSSSTNLTSSDIQELYAEAPNDISTALKPYGYFKAEVSGKLTQIKKDAWVATYTVKPGPLLRLTNVDIKITGDGAATKEFQNFLATFPLHTNDILDTTKYSQAKQNLYDLALRHGYIIGAITKSEIRINLTEYKAAITLYFNTGPHYYFGNVIFSKSRYSAKFLTKFLTFKPGEYYASDKIHTSQANLIGSNLFQNISIEPQFKETKNLQVPILVNVIPRKSLQYNFGLGYGTDTSFRASLGIEAYNISPDGQHMNALVKASLNKNVDMEAHYIIPGINPMTDQFDISVASEYQEPPYGNSILLKGGPGYTTNIFGWRQTVRVDLHSEHWTFKDQPRNSNTMFVPSVTWLKRKADDPVRPTQGYNFNFLLQGAVQNYGANFNFILGQANGKIMYQIPRGPILVLSGTAGYISTNNDNNLPLSFWFSAGGANSVRGYNYQDIGPGKELAEATVELRQKLFNDFYAAVFYDAGNAANSAFKDPFQRQSAGLGVVYLSQIGAFRLSYANATDGLIHSNGKIQFSMGPDL
jgi:translocation and assembly module TamA